MRLLAWGLAFREMHEALLRENLEDVLHALAAEDFGSPERQFERGALDVRQQDLKIVGIDQGVLGRRVEEVRRVADDVLVERGAAGHQHGGRLPGAPAGPTRALPRRRDRARIAREHGHVERADVDPQLEGARGDHRPHVPVAQPFLDLAPPVWQVASPVPPHHIVRPGRALHGVLQVARQDLGDQAALGEHDHLQAAPQEFERDATRLLRVRPADAELLVDDRRVDEEEELLAPRRAAFFHEFERALGEPFGQLPRVGNGRRRTDEHRVGAVMFTDAAQPAQDVCQVAAEHAAIRVQLVDDDETEVLEETRPLRVVRQDPRVQHVGVGQDHLRPRADGSPRVLRRVAVVSEDAEVEARRFVEHLRQAIELGQLVLRERLGRKQVESPRRRLVQDRVEDGDVVAERLARRGRRGHHDALTRHRVGDGGGLVRVQLGDAAAREGLDQARVHAGRHRRQPRVGGRHAADGRDDLVRRIGAVPLPRRDEVMDGGLQRLLTRGTASGA